MAGCRECASGHCADGYCCDAACAGGCDTCALSAGASANGTCTVLPPGNAGNPSCAPFACDGASGACPGSCTADSGCAPDFFCAVDNTCKPRYPLARACTRDGEGLSGACADGVCCDQACDGVCLFCKLGGYQGTCMPVPDDEDPRKECQAATGGSTACAGKCVGGQCAYPDVGTTCGTCAACDGTGRRTETPADDPACGTIACGGLDTACRAYADLVANRCAALGECKQANDPAWCTSYADLPCLDGGQPPGDGGQPGGDGGAAPGGSSGCGCRAASARQVAPWVLPSLALILVRRVGPRRRTVAVTRGVRGPARPRRQ